MTAKEHNKLLSIFMMAHGGLQIFGVIIMVLLYGGIGTAMIANARRDEEQMIGSILIGVMLVVAFISLFSRQNFQSRLQPPMCNLSNY